MHWINGSGYKICYYRASLHSHTFLPCNEYINSVVFKEPTTTWSLCHLNDTHFKFKGLHAIPSKISFSIIGKNRIGKVNIHSCYFMIIADVEKLDWPKLG